VKQWTLNLYCWCREALPENWHSSYRGCPQWRPGHRTPHLDWCSAATEGRSTAQRNCHGTCEYRDLPTKKIKQLMRVVW